MDTDPKRDELAPGLLETIQQLYEDADEYGSPIPRDPTGGLSFRKGVPEALLHLARNNRQAVHSLTAKTEQDMRDAVAALAQRREESGATIAAIPLLYWHCPDIPARVIAQAFNLTPQRVQEIAEAHPITTFRCLDCDAPLQPQSREHFRQMWRAMEELDRYPERLKMLLYTGLHCADCTAERGQRWGDEWRRQEREYQQRLLELRTMPYEEYLRTPEWRIRRERKLEQADYRCQFCNRHKSSLDVHHRTYENRGEELDTDLIVVCRDCHSTFHKHRRLRK